MNLAICIVAIVAAILLGWKLNLNTGIFAMAFAFIIGTLILDLSAMSIMRFWPTTIVFYLIAIGIFFSYGMENGTMDVLGQKLLHALGGNAKIIPFAIAITAAIVGGLGAGASTGVIIGPFVFVIAIAAGVHPVLTVIAIGFGNIMGCSNPFNGFGGIVGLNLMKDNYVDSGMDAAQINMETMGLAYRVWANTAIIAGVLIIIFYFVFKSYKNKKIEVANPPAFTPVQKKTFIVVIIAFFCMVIPSVLYAWMPRNPVIAVMYQLFQPQVVMIFGSVICALMKLAPERAVLKRVPINTIIMIVGVYMLIKVTAEAGLVEAITVALSSSIPRFLVPGSIVFFSAFLSFFSSSISTVMPLMYPLVPGIASTLGYDPGMLYTCIFFGGLTTALSPFSTGGALTIAACGNEKVRQALPNQMIVATWVIALITVVWATLGLLGIV